jgi:2,3-bisphosphoglycerate-dependent phosphoglycerate mutase
MFLLNLVEIFIMGKFVFILSIGLLFLCSCKKEKVVETVTVRDTVYVHDTTVIPAMISDTTTTLIVLRHAEKESTGADPNLDADGVARAEELKYILSNVPVTAIYSTSFNRTKQTVQPLASAKGLSVSVYDANKPYAQLVSDIKAERRGKVSVIVGHSNTVPEILKELSKGSFNVSIAESHYDNLFIVNLPDSLAANIMHIKYGKSTP